MDVNVERNLLAKFHKNERDIFAWNQNPRNSWLSQALIEGLNGVVVFTVIG